MNKRKTESQRQSEMQQRYGNLKGNGESLFARWWGAVDVEKHGRHQILAGIGGMIAALANDADTTEYEVLSDLRYLNQEADEDAAKMAVIKHLEKCGAISESKPVAAVAVYPYDSPRAERSEWDTPGKNEDLGDK